MQEAGDFSRLLHFRRNMNVKSHSILFRVVAFIVCFSIFIGCCPTIFAENGGNASVVKYKTNGEIVEATLTEIGTFSDSEDTMIAMGDGTSGKVYLAALPEGAAPYQIIAYYTAYSTDGNGLKIPYYYTKTSNTYPPFSTIIENDDSIVGDMLTGAEFLSVGGDAFSKAVHFNDGFVLPTENVTGFVVYDFDDSGASKQGNIIYVQIPVSDEPEEPVTKTELEEAINSALSTSGYYTENDRWNGKTASNNKDGFWAEMQAVISAAKAVYDDPNATQKVVNDAAASLDTTNENSALSKAIANLIPKTKVNATALYEAWQSAKGEQSSNYSEVTWTPFEAARTAAKELLDKLYDENGDPTVLNRGPNATVDAPEGAVLQTDVDTAAALLREKEAALYSASADSGNTAILGYAKKMFPALIALAEQAKQADYTAESWSTFATALEAAKNAKAPTLTGTSADKATVAAYKKAFDDLYEQFYCRLTPAGEIKVSLVYTDPNDPHEYGTAAGARGGAAETVTLDGSYSVYDAVQKLANKPTNAVWNAAKIFINGRYVSQNYLDQTKTEAHLGVVLSKAVKLHPNDEVVVLAYSSPQTTTSQNIGSADAMLWQYISSLKTSRFTQGSKLKVEAGQQVTLNVQSTPAALGSGATTEAAANMTLMTSAKVDEPSGSHPTPTIISIDGNAVKTGADGSATLTFYHEGWYLVTAYDLQKDELGAYDASNVGTENRAGNYHSTNSGAAIWIQVGAASNPTAVKNTLTSKLTSVKNAYAESYFRPENWKKIEAAYKTAVSGITNAESIGDAYDAQQTGILAIKKIQDDTTKENEKNLKTFHTQIGRAHV